MASPLHAGPANLEHFNAIQHTLANIDTSEARACVSTTSGALLLTPVTCTHLASTLAACATPLMYVSLVDAHASGATSCSVACVFAPAHQHSHTNPQNCPMSGPPTWRPRWPPAPRR